MERLRVSSERIQQITRLAEYGLLAIGILHLSRFAFSWESKQEILRRDGYQCTKCGSTEHLEAAHYNHTRDENYDNPDNGRILCTECHLEDHIHRPNNGLSRKHNQWAIRKMQQKIADRAVEFFKQLELPV